MAFVKNAAQQFQALRVKKMQESTENKTTEDSTKDNNTENNEEDTQVAKTDNDLEAEEAKKLVDALTSDNSTKEIVKSAAEAVGSLSETEFDVKFNTDVFQPHVKLADEEVGYEWFIEVVIGY